VLQLTEKLLLVLRKPLAAAPMLLLLLLSDLTLQAFQVYWLMTHWLLCGDAHLGMHLHRNQQAITAVSLDKPAAVTVVLHEGHLTCVKFGGTRLEVWPVVHVQPALRQLTRS